MKGRARIDDKRRAELGAIHLGKKRLGLDEETYRAMLQAVSGVQSAKDLDSAGRRAVIEHMRARGFKKAKLPPPGNGPRPRPSADREPMVRKVWALLAEAGRDGRYADAIARRMAGVEFFEWLPVDQLHDLVAALMIDKRRRVRRPGGGRERG